MVVYSKRKRKRRYSNVGRTPRKGWSRTFGRHGLHHEFHGAFRLESADENKNATILPLLACDATLNNPDSVYVNPRHSSVTNANDHLTYGSSVVKKIHYDLKIMLDSTISNGWQGTLLCMPIMIKYDDLDKESGGETITSYIPLAEHGSDEKIRPNWNANDINDLSDFYDGDGLTTDNNHEGVVFDPESFETALAEKPISPLLRSVTAGGLSYIDVHKEHPLHFHGTIRVPKKVQLQTEHTFYALLLKHADYDMRHQFPIKSEAAVTNALMHIGYSFSFYEWNKEFNQTVG